MINNWNKLDNAAKIFPSATAGANTHVFRVSCTLKDDIDPAILQDALLETVERIPVYQYVMHRGIFWYYLEKTDLLPVIEEEHKPVCGGIYDPNVKKLLYEVAYYKRRINFEMYHVLGDGAGALNFLKTLVNIYISKKYKTVEKMLDIDASHSQLSGDSFLKYADTDEKRKIKLPKISRACKVRGQKIPDSRLKIINGLMDTDSVLKAAHLYGATVTAFICACLIMSIAEEMPAKDLKRPVVISVPVNLRQLFKSESGRNFFSLCYVKYDLFNKKTVFEDVVRDIDAQLKSGLKPENIKDRVDPLVKTERNFFVRMAPLFIKDIVLNIAYRQSQSRESATISNLGVIKMPDNVQKYIDKFDVMISTESLQGCVCSYNGKLSISFASRLINSDIEKRFFRRLEQYGASITISASNAE